jgi:Na+/H+ antiporter NhaD/arsenite permease-like protein
MFPNEAGMISTITLIIVLAAIAMRQLLNIRLAIWQIMLMGALAVLLLGQISFTQAWQAINVEIISYLLGVFIIGRALELSGYLDRLTAKTLHITRNGYTLLALSMTCFAISSALLMNDTVVIIGTPLLLLITEKHPALRTPLLLGLAFSVTIGSVLTPIGNPQNLLIAVGSNMPHVFLQFLQHFTLPVILSLLLAYLVLAVCYRHVLAEKIIPTTSYSINTNKTLQRLSSIALLILLTLIIIKIALANLTKPINLPFDCIALIAVLPILVGSQQRLSIVKTIDWPTLIFFVAMFILMASVWQSGSMQWLLHLFHSATSQLLGILILSVLLSQLFSNVPLVALLLPALLAQHAQAHQLLALAAGSTIAGNLLIIGAASNIIIIQSAEKRKQRAFGSWEFTRIGIPITCLSLLVFYLCLNF